MIKNKILINILLIIFSHILISIPVPAGPPSDPELETLFKTASLWQVGENKDRVEDARTKLISLGEPAVRFIVENKIDNPTGLESRAIDSVILKLPEISEIILIEKLKNQTSTTGEKNNCIILLAKLKSQKLQEYIISLFSKPEHQGAVVYYAMELKVTRAEPLILKVIFELDEPKALNYLKALGIIGGPKTISVLFEYLSSDRNIILRTTAENSLKSITKHRPEIIVNKFKDTRNARLKYHLVNIMGSENNPLYLKALLEAIDSSEGVLKLNIIRNLQPYLQQSSNVRNKLEFQLRDEKDPEIKNYLKKTLAF